MPQQSREYFECGKGYRNARNKSPRVVLVEPAGRTICLVEPQITRVEYFFDLA